MRQKKPIKRRAAALATVIALPVLLYAYTWFMGHRPALHVKSERTLVDVLIQNSDILLALLFLGACALPFYLVFERKRPKAREIVPIALMAALCVAGRAAFALIPLPNFKPVSAIIIITALAFGPEAGFLTGALAGFVSNFLFGQGPWTPWQMFCWGCIGLGAGFLYRAGVFGPVGRRPADEKGKRKKPYALCVYGLLCGFLYGWVMNLYYLIGYVDPLTWETALAAYVSSFFFDLSHGVCTFLVLWLAGEDWVRKLLRIKKKFGLMGEEGSFQMPPSTSRTEGGDSI